MKTNSTDFSCSVSAVSTKLNAASSTLWPVVVAVNSRFALLRHFRTRQHRRVCSPEAAAALRAAKSQLDFFTDINTPSPS
uniref:Uncharacterized protein n=1 Tax=Hyaloperonospora arabidopsidis (strain Emoy2) TaxID=559515 RepID=M4B4D4_HYAAE